MLVPAFVLFGLVGALGGVGWLDLRFIADLRVKALHQRVTLHYRVSLGARRAVATAFPSALSAIRPLRGHRRCLDLRFNAVLRVNAVL